MQLQKYGVSQQPIETLLAWVKSGEIAIPEIQRPFVWDASKVRDLMDSLYRGYPVGYLIAWKNQDVRLKNGQTSAGKKILIDGQQRVTALTAAVLGQKVVNQDYRAVRIRIAFQPMLEKFEVANNATDKDTAWIADISELMSGAVPMSKVRRDYCADNPGIDQDQLEDRLERLRNLLQRQVGLIELASELDIETVTEIFIRINSQGKPLSQADFVMSKIAANEVFNGPRLRKTIDYFCHLAVAPEFHDRIVEGDPAFAATEQFKAVAWLKHENDDLYDPDYVDVLRVAFGLQFARGKLSDLVSLLSGRNFETRAYEDEIARDAFAGLERGVLAFVSKTHFERLVMIIKSAGFIVPSMIRSKNALNFAYMLYLRLRELGVHEGDIERSVRRWFVMSLLTGRYSGSFETQFESDLKAISERPVTEVLNSIEQGKLSEAFWTALLPQELETSSSSSAMFQVFIASQVRAGDSGFLSAAVTVAGLVQHRGDVHHLFPKAYLQRYEKKRGAYNQIANFVYTQTEINIAIRDAEPRDYMGRMRAQVSGGPLAYGSIRTEVDLRANLAANAVPETLFEMTVDGYESFLSERRALMAAKMQRFYESL